MGFLKRLRLVGKKCDDIFADVIGYEDIKHVLNLALLSEKSVAIVLSGAYGIGKTKMLKKILEKYPKHAVWFDCSAKMITAAGFREFLFNNKHMKILILDELSRMGVKDQEILLNLIEGGTITNTKANTGYRKEHFKNLKIFASSNNIEKLIGALRSRMDEYELPPYTYEQFRSIGLKIHSSSPDKELVLNAIDAVWYTLKSRDMRDLNKLMDYGVTSKEDLDKLISTKLKYRANK